MGLVSKILGGGEADKAGKAVAQGFRESEDILKDYGQKSLDYLSPYNKLGSYGANAIESLYGPNASFDAFRSDPGYEFRFDEGMRAVDNSGAARGMTMSGAQLKALTRFGQGTADQGFGDWYNRQFNLANLGANTANSMANINQNTGSGVAAARQGIGEARGSGYMAQANQKNSLANNVVGGVLGNWGGITKSLGGLF